MSLVPVRPDDRAGLRAPLVFAALILLVFGFAYSLAGTFAGGVFPSAADGSRVESAGRAVGSALVAQPFAGDRYFQPRPSAANYDPMAAAGSNQARSHPDLRARIAATIVAVAAREDIAPSDVPADLVTQSGSGLDPHLSPRGAQVQVARVARARGLSEPEVAILVREHTEPPQFGVLGEARVNVLRLNLALDARP
jgi:K+-transporting ATPase ATPase C chain